ncbi:YkgJ family cysteine cluster protein [Desulforamulus putei]|uniref:YkgJ family cysteine cluster protein n=1 Tax=Desulforamulus putei TaxID=74701 RepID=UPI002FDC8AE7
MDRLPLNYEQLYAKWHRMAPEIRSGHKFFPRSATAEIWESKLHLMHNIIQSHPDADECDRCGQCCRDFPFACRPIEFFYLLPYLASRTEERQRQFFYRQLGRLRGDGRNYCPFHEAAGCSIYPVRPLLCRRSIFGDHICNKRSRQFASFGEWCNFESVVKQLTITNLVYYYDDGPKGSVELNWPLTWSNRQGIVSLTVAPFEIWLLLLLGEQNICRKIMTLENFQPILGFLQGGGLAYTGLSHEGILT